MATKTGSLNRGTNISSPASIGITCGAYEYPDGNLTSDQPIYFNWKGSGSPHGEIYVYISDSTGKLTWAIASYTIPGGSTGQFSIGKSWSMSNVTAFAGYSLYMYAKFVAASGGSPGTITSVTAYPNANATLSLPTTYKSYTLTTTVSPANYGTVTAGGTLTYGGTKSLTASASTGRYFSSWSKTAGTLSSTTTNPTTFTMGAGNATVTANFGTSSYTLTTAVSPSGGGTVTAGGSVAYQGTKSLTATPSSGYSFSSWSKTAGTLSSTTSNPTTFTMGTSNATVTANFTKNNYTLTTTVSPSGAGSVTAGGTLAYQGTKSLTATAGTGYTFSSWSKTAGTLSSTTSNPTTFTMGAGNATVTANFTANNYTLTTTVSPAGAGSVTAGGSVAYKSTKSLTATASTGYTFSSWSKTAGTLSSTTSNPTTFTMPASAATVTANFTANSYTLTTTVSPAGGGTVTAGGSIAYKGTKSLTATPSAGYTFSSWSKTAGTLSSTTTNPTTFTMPASAATVTANFTKIDYTVTTGVSPSGSGTLSSNKATAQIGDSVTLTPSAARGYTFSSYTTDPSVTITNNQFTMPASNITITANFTFTPSRSTGTLNKQSYSGGETAVLTIDPDSASLTHRYKLSFKDGMETAWTDVAAGVTQVNIYIPVEWFRHIVPNTSIATGTLYLETYNGGDKVGSTYEITNITYTNLDNTIPAIDVWRCDENGNAQTDGEYGKYALTIPSSISSSSLVYSGTTIQNPETTGDILPNDRQTFPTDGNYPVGLTMTYGNETFTVNKDIPKIAIVTKFIYVNRQ